MNWDKVKSTLVTIAPWIAGTFGTPAAGVAVKVLCDTLGADIKTATPDTLQTAISSATPEQLLSLKQADLKHAEFMQQLGYQNIQALANATVEDRDSARKREISVKDNTPKWLAALSAVLFIALIIETVHGSSMADGMRDVYMILVGAAITVFKDVYGYYFGSSASSHTKDETISNLSK